MGYIDLVITTTNEISIRSGYRKDTIVSFGGIDTDDILEQLTIKDVLSKFKIDDNLEEIGIDKVKDYFNLIETEE